ncbi:MULTISPECIES: YfhO family protein [unclassified Streptococcus]|uniref:YfhO family protein n=1 Tax=unclassified Streptococcus TaxID=2608887 RepID=UPI001071E094|nr:MULTISPECIES: YfhO family protein [unclassified Streptococcus]MBF0786975.1 YfhO family protein [Streptococcus sp. 19428wC2_LYSM12]MCQ9211519.1 YfhO family protein [Streptococcus sp. B01]MCQ9214835.1 YfhO family protein [Streptococcus sp. O1]TFV06173.1 copper ABC transporter permease [Streptococcus sp. LYSM12]
MFKKYSKYLFLGVSFALPVLIITIILALKGIWWGSKTTILASDAFHQYVIFNQVLRNTLHGDGSLFYTFTSGLGLNFYALSSYYLGSILSPLVYFFDLKSMPDALYLFTLLKFGLTGLSTYFSLSTIYKKLQPTLAILLSTSFSLMSFSTSQLEINIWLDTFILVPLILLGLHRIMERKGRILYFVSLVLLFIQNYYFGYMMALFLSIWFLVQLSWNFKKRIGSLIDFTVVSLLAGLSSMVILLPSYLDLKTHGEQLTQIVNLQTENSWYLDLFAKNLVGSYDTTKFGAIPMIYVGIFPLLLALLFFTVKSIKWQVKMSYGLLLIIIIASFYLQPLDLFWQGMHAPNMFLHRYAWIFSLVIIYMAADTLTRLSSIHFREYLIPLLLLSIGFGATFFFLNRYEFLTPIHLLLSLEFLIAYGILLFAVSKNHIKWKVFSGISLVFVLFEVSLNTNYQVDGLATEWHFPSRDSYEQNLIDIDNLVKYTKSTNSEFYRTERLFPQTGNDSMKYNYNGISQFSSIRNRTSSSTLDKLGFRSDGTNLNLRYQNNTIIADSLFAIRYNIAEGKLTKFGFSPVHSSGSYSLYENTHSLPLAILTTNLYKDVNFSNLTLDNQTNFLNQLAGLDLQYYYSLEPSSHDTESELNNRIILSKPEEDEPPRTQYTVLVPANTQLYVNIPNISFASDSNKNVQFTINNVTKNFTLDNTFSFFDAGYFEHEQLVTLTISFPNNSQVSFDKPQFYQLDTSAYQVAMDKLKKQDVQVKTKGNKIYIDYTSDTDASLLVTLPYDKGWSARQDTKTLPIKKAQNGFMKIGVTKGNGMIILSFIPQGFVIGACCFVAGTLLFILYNRIRNNKHGTRKN